MRLGLVGACGRMGRAITRIAEETGEAIVAHPIGAGTDLAAIAPDDIDVLVDFSNPAALGEALGLARRIRRPVLVGTTGLGPDHHAMIDRAASEVAVMQTGNTSLGINLLRVLVQQAASRLGTEWDIEILDLHHRNKLDAPSGTALMLGAAAADGRGAAPEELGRSDRMSGGPHPREPGTIYYASLRGGTAAGEHMVLFAGEGERVELRHIAENRLVFARGALKAARWLIGQTPGRYVMADLFREAAA